MAATIALIVIGGVVVLGLLAALAVSWRNERRATYTGKRRIKPPEPRTSLISGRQHLASGVTGLPAQPSSRISGILVVAPGSVRAIETVPGQQYADPGCRQTLSSPSRE
jgi:hypothetical protein